MRQALIKEIQALGKFILAKVARIDVQLIESKSFSISILTTILGEVRSRLIV